jgi:hypothetical protein
MMDLSAAFGDHAPKRLGVGVPLFERHLACLGPSGFHRVAYDEWSGPAGAPMLVCVHGLSRNAHDFDAIAAVLSRRYRVVCPDMPGRGRSEWLANPADHANFLLG